MSATNDKNIKVERQVVYLLQLKVIT
jgi:hypothetical protein